MAIALREPHQASRTGTFSRVLVGVAATPGSRAAAWHGAMLVDDGGTLELLAAFEHEAPGDAPQPIFLDAEPRRERARERLAEAARDLPRGVVTTTVAPGRLEDALVDELALGHETCVVIDAGAGAVELLHRAACTVLVARAGARTPPATIVVGIDGSPESQAAYRVGRVLAERFGARLVPLVARGGSGFDAEAVRRIAAGRPELSPRDPAAALTAASVHADLVIVGNRGLHGAAGVGSVALRAACDADCSVLVVRSP